MGRIARILGQGLAYLAFGLTLAYASNRPVYQHFPADKALIKVSLSHSGKPKGECRTLSAAELGEMNQNMRRPKICPRERLPLTVEILLDGAPLMREVLPPSGLSKDGAAHLYRRFVVSPGRHRIEARLRDSARAQGFDYEGSTEVTLAPGQNFVIDFRSETGGFIFR